MSRPLHPLLAEFRDVAHDHLDHLRGYFIAPVKLTLLVRNLEAPDGSRDILVTEDEPEAIIEAVRRRARGEPR